MTIEMGDAATKEVGAQQKSLQNNTDYTEFHLT